MILELDTIKMMLDESGWVSREQAEPEEGKAVKVVNITSMDNCALSHDTWRALNQNCYACVEYWKYLD